LTYTNWYSVTTADQSVRLKLQCSSNLVTLYEPNIDITAFIKVIVIVGVSVDHVYVLLNVGLVVIVNKCKKLNSLKHPVRTTVAGSHN